MSFVHRLWYSSTLRSIGAQVLLAAGAAWLAWTLVANTFANLEARNITTGFGFLWSASRVPIGESVVAYAAGDSYARAILVGIANTLVASLVAIVTATVLGTLFGLARLSQNLLLRNAATAYVELMRNIPIIVMLFFWYGFLTHGLPPLRQALQPLPGVFLSTRGLQIPTLSMEGDVWLLAAAIGTAMLLAFIILVFARRYRVATGRAPRVWPAALAVLVGLPAAAVLAGGVSVSIDRPALKGFNFVGGTALSPEFTALFLGLTLYTAAFIAEIVRSGIVAVKKGQREAAVALGLRPGQAMRLVVLPQALRVIVPPLTSQYLNVVKNSSLALAIGYPDLVAIVNATINITNQAIEGVLIIMATYLTISLSIAVFMNWYNRRIAFVER